MQGKYKILLVGAGNIGFRYLQGLNETLIDLDIYIVDISEKSLDLVKEKIKSFKKNSIINFYFYKNILKLNDKFDIAIITTTANQRHIVIESIIKKCKVNFWVLEKVLSQSNSDLELIRSFLGHRNNTWVNHSRRVMNFYKDIKKSSFFNIENSPFSIEIKGSNWGLACNALHFIDLISWLIDSNLKSIDSSGLSTWVDSKREGFKEVFGQLDLFYSDTSKLRLICDNGLPSKISIKIENTTGILSINEYGGFALMPTGKKIVGKLEYVSETTTKFIKQILIYKKCDLTKLEDSLQQHQIFLNSLKSHMNKESKSNLDKLPIT